MMQKKAMNRQFVIIHVAIAFTLTFLLGLELKCGAYAASKVRLISPTPYLFPELSISGHLFNFLPPFSARAESSSSSKNRNSGDKYKLTSSQEEATKLVQIASKSVDDHSNKKYFEKSNTNNGVVPSLSRESTKSSNNSNNVEPNLRSKKRTHNRQYIGSHMGGVGGVFPPVITESPKVGIRTDQHTMLRENDSTSRIYSNIGISTRKDSTCIYDDELYNAGEMIKLGHKSSPCDKCRCEKHKGGGIIKCFWQECEGLPAFDCVPYFVPGACCPIYSCDDEND